jgi:Tfp pilus assembly protein PilN
MQTHAIVELEEGSLFAALVGRAGRTLRVTRSLRLPLADLGRDTVLTALRGLGNGIFAGVRGVHVVLSDRRLQHFVCTLPRMTPADVGEFVAREGLRLTGAMNAADVFLSVRLLRRAPGQRFVVAGTALAKSVWEPLREAFAQSGIPVLGLHSVEACLALAATPDTGGRAAILECSGGRARFVSCDGDAPLQVRRFMITGGGETSPEALVAQLAMEVPRTIDWLRETGHGVPSSLVLGNRVGVDESSMEMLRGDITNVVRARVDVSVADGETMPGLAVLMLADRLAGAAAPPSLLAEPRIELPWSQGRFASVAALLAAGLVCSWSAVVDVMVLVRAREERTAAVAETLALQQDLASVVSAETQTPAAGEAEARLQGALEMRRPASRLLAEVGNCAGPELHIEELKFASTDRIVVTGVVTGSSRKIALGALADFARLLRNLPYLEVAAQQEVAEVPEQNNRFRFRLSMAWRNS